jgi:hypothetical protein
MSRLCGGRDQTWPSSARGETALARGEAAQLNPDGGRDVQGAFRVFAASGWIT